MDWTDSEIPGEEMHSGTQYSSEDSQCALSSVTFGKEEAESQLGLYLNSASGREKIHH